MPLRPFFVVLGRSLFAALLLIQVTAHAQFGQPSRFELIHGSGDQGFTTISLRENGLALIREKRVDGNKRPWELIVLDSTLTQTWTTDVPLDPKFKLIGYEYSAGELFFLFRQNESDFNDFHLVRIFLFSRAIQHMDIAPKLEFRLTHFIIAANSAVLGGYVSRQPAVIIHDLATDHVKVVPGFFIDNTELLELKSNNNGTFNALLIERGNRDKKKLLLKTFDASGSLLLEDDIDVDDNKLILGGTTSSLAHDELLLAGVWGTGKNNTKQSTGIFTVLVDPFNKQPIRYYDFAELNHFLDYLPPKRVAKIKNKAEHRRSSEKPPVYRINVHVIKIEETTKGFAMLCELYIPTISTNYPYYNPYYYPGYNPYYSPYYNPYSYGYSPYGYNPMMMNRYYNSPYNPYGSTGRNADVTMLLSSLILFDKEGKHKDDFGFKLNELKLGALEQTSDFLAGEHFVQFYKSERNVFFSSSWMDDNPAEIDTIKIQLKSAADVVRNESDEQGGVRYWYGRYAYAWGYETIKNKVDPEKDPIRHVYYVNKIKLD